MIKQKKVNQFSFGDFMNDSSTYFLGFTKSKHWVGAIIDLFVIFILVSRQENDLGNIFLEGIVIWAIGVSIMYYFWKKRMLKQP